MRWQVGNFAIDNLLSNAITPTFQGFLWILLEKIQGAVCGAVGTALEAARGRAEQAGISVGLGHEVWEVPASKTV
jgi:hypothetical protein